MINYIIENATLIGLIFFFSVFVFIAFWAFRPSAKQDFEKQGNIPLKEEENE